MDKTITHEEIKRIAEEVKQAVSLAASNNPQHRQNELIRNILQEMPKITEDNLLEYLHQIHSFTIVGNKQIDKICALLAHLLREFVDNEILSFTGLYHINNDDHYFLFEGKRHELVTFTADELPDSYKAILYRYAIGIFLLILSALEG